ncbi:F0F1 ATP synthase subunit B [Spiroplasma endosymbiont of Crioceris asparagi]|uniref:F0F1 ATP synthase subunit B n=1 Tax=Spiroplasma endosymbiont of Crioceris asparagi TaxID=3066286 RepID=UPI0030CAEE04
MLNMLFLSDDTTPGVPDINEALFPNIPNLIAHLIATVVLVIILSKLLYKPAKKLINDRRKKINELLDQALEKQIEISKIEEETKQIFAEAQGQSKEIINSAISEALVEKNEIISKTKIEVEHLQNTAKNNIELSKKEAEKSMKQEVTNLAFEIASKLLESNVSKKDNEKYINELLDKIGE